MNEIKRIETATYPICPFCQGSIRRACTLKVVGKDEVFIICASCFRIYNTLSRMTHYGLIREAKE